MSHPKKTSKPITIHENPFSKVVLYNVDFYKFKKDYYVTYFGPRVGVVVVKDGNILLVKQYRFIINRDSLEIPGGAVEKNETPDEAVKRELYEEAGVVCIKIRKLATFYPGLDNVDNLTTVFLCDDFEIAENFCSSEEETTESVWMPIRQCIDEILSGKQIDSLTIIGIMCYYGSLTKE